MTVTFDQIRPRLLEPEDVRARFSVTEPLSEIMIARGNQARFELNDGWNNGVDALRGIDPVDCFVNLGRTRYRFTKDALFEATSSIGLTKQYVSKTPARLITPHINYWFENTDKEQKLLCANNLVYAMTKSSITPFSNVAIFDAALTKIQETFGVSEVLVDYKFKHDLRKTHYRFVVPDVVRNVRPEDTWCVGLQAKNSLTGEEALSFNGYLFRWVCTNGMISTRASSGNWSRRHGGQDFEEVMAWANNAIDDILGGFEHEFAALDAAANTRIDGEVNDVLADIFREYRVPLAARDSIIENMVESDDLTFYGVINAITQSANADGLTPEAVERLLLIGGDLSVHAARCDSCHRLLV